MIYLVNTLKTITNVLGFLLRKQCLCKFFSRQTRSLFRFR